MYNILHSASAPGLRDAMGPVRRRRALRWRRRAVAAAPAPSRAIGAASASVAGPPAHR